MKETMFMINVGLQLFSVRDACEKDFIGTIEKVAGIGYKGLEFAGYFGIDALELRRVLDRLDIVAVNSHVSVQRLTDNMDAEIEYARILGMKTITIPALPKDIRKNIPALLEMSQLFPGFAEKCRQNGLQLCYHNHDFEFAKVENEYLLDIFLNATKGMRLELDTFWSEYAGLDTKAFMRQHADRLEYIHLKDMIRGSEPHFAEVGEGCLDIRSFVRTAVDLGVTWAIVEQDTCAGDSLACVKTSLDNLKKMGLTQ